MDNTGKVILSKGIKLDKQYKNIVDYTETQMVNLCVANKVYESTDCSFIKINEAIEVDCTYGVAITANYIAYQNPNYSNKWFFGFIDSVEYISDGCTRINFTIDELSTWRDYWDIKTCFTIREHVNDDTVGLNTVPENIEIGDYEIVDLRYSSLYESQVEGRPDFSIIFCVTKIPSRGGNYATAEITDNRVAGSIGYIGGVYSSLSFFAVKTPEDANIVLKLYEQSDATTDAIKNIYIVPSGCVNYDYDPDPVTGYSRTSYIYTREVFQRVATLYPLYNYYESPSAYFVQPDVLAENYSPVNKKLLSYPFSYFFVTNNSGESIDYKYEDFPFQTISPSTTPQRIISYSKRIVPSTSVSAKLVFDNYKAYSSATSYTTKLNAYGINFSKIPVCAWTGDYYTNWLTQNGVNVGTNLALGVAGATVGLLTGGVGLIAGGLALGSSISNAVSQVHKATTVPPQSNGDINTGDFNFCFARNIISFYFMSIRPEYARIIDDYFTRQGYKVNRLKVPNETGRTYWNYVQIANDDCIGTTKNTISVPTSSMDVINNAYRAGVTIWHDHANIGNYSLSNTIVTPTP